MSRKTCFEVYSLKQMPKLWTTMFILKNIPSKMIFKLFTKFYETTYHFCPNKPIFFSSLFNAIFLFPSVVTILHFFCGFFSKESLWKTKSHICKQYQAIFLIISFHCPVICVAASFSISFNDNYSSVGNQIIFNVHGWYKNALFACWQELKNA